MISYFVMLLSKGGFSPPFPSFSPSTLIVNLVYHHSHSLLLLLVCVRETASLCSSHSQKIPLEPALRGEGGGEGRNFSSQKEEEEK